jgi:glycosyltransferase involved in cell wall biosynthesis
VVEDFAPWNPVFTHRLKDRPAIIQIQNRLGTQIFRKYGPLGLPFYIRELSYPKRFAHAIVINDALNDRFKIKGHVISMGVDEELLNVAPVEGDYVAFLGRLDFHQKGIDLLLSAVRELKLPLKLAGDGPARARLVKTIKNLPNVEWLGWLEGGKKLEFLRRARFLAVPSRFEGQNMAVLEAAAVAKAAVVSDIEELSYAVRHGFALPFRNGSVAGLGNSLQMLWENAGLRGQLQAAARHYVSGLTWPQLADRYEAFCRDVILASR